MSWVTILAIAVVTILVANSIMVMRSRASRGERLVDDFSLSTHLTKTGTIVYGLFTILFFVGPAARDLVPETMLGRWVVEHGLWTYWMWWMVVMIFVEVVLHFMGYPSWKKKGAA